MPPRGDGAFGGPTRSPKEEWEGEESGTLLPPQVPQRQGKRPGGGDWCAEPVSQTACTQETGTGGCLASPICTLT